MPYIMPDSSGVKHISVPPEPPIPNYAIVIYCTLAKISVQRKFTDEQLDSFIDDVLKNGYSDVTTGKTTIYPAHTITKIEMTIA
jgi:hypothetical protein